jgi:hypothetical protein
MPVKTDPNYWDCECEDNFIDLNEQNCLALYVILTKEEFLTSYSYLTEQEYDNTKREVNND